MCVGCVVIRAGDGVSFPQPSPALMTTGNLENMEDVTFRTGFPKAVLWTSSPHIPCVSC